MQGYIGKIDASYFLVFGRWKMVNSPWSMVNSPWSIVQSAWTMVYDSLNLQPCISIALIKN